MSDEKVPLAELAEKFTVNSEVERISVVLMKTWAKHDPESAPSQHPASYVATFLDLARAVVEPEHEPVIEEVPDLEPHETAAHPHGDHWDASCRNLRCSWGVVNCGEDEAKNLAREHEEQHA